MTIADATASADGGGSKFNNRPQNETSDVHQSDGATKFVPQVDSAVCPQLTKQRRMFTTTLSSTTRTRRSSFWMTDVEKQQGRAIRSVRNSNSIFLFSFASVMLWLQTVNGFQLSSQLERLAHRGGVLTGQQSIVRGIQQSLVLHHGLSSTSSGATKSTKTFSWATTSRSACTTSTCLSMSLVPLPVEDLQELIVTGVPSGDQYATYFGRTKREKYSKYFAVSCLSSDDPRCDETKI